MPPINIRKKQAKDDIIALRPFPSESKLKRTPVHSISTADAIFCSPRMQLMKTLTTNEVTERLALPPLPSCLLSPINLSPERFSSGPKSNQTMNLEMSFKSKMVKVPPPRVAINISDLQGVGKESTQVVSEAKINPKNTIKLKPIQRTVHSSQGGTIKILLPRNFVTGETRPNSIEDNMPKTISSASSSKSHAINSGNNPFLNKVLEMSKKKSTARNNPIINQRTCNREEHIEELCNITFGKDEYQNSIEI